MARRTPSDSRADLDAANLLTALRSQYAVTAGAASAILAWLFPEEAQYFEEQAPEAVNSRLLADVEYPSDVEAGLELGRQVAELVIERGKADSSDADLSSPLVLKPGLSYTPVPNIPIFTAVIELPEIEPPAVPGLAV